MIINFHKQLIIILFREKRLLYDAYMSKKVKLHHCMKFEMVSFKFTLSRFGRLPFKQGHGSCKPREGPIELIFSQLVGFYQDRLYLTIWRKSIFCPCLMTFRDFEHKAGQNLETLAAQPLKVLETSFFHNRPDNCSNFLSMLWIWCQRYHYEFRYLVLCRIIIFLSRFDDTATFYHS